MKKKAKKKTILDHLYKVPFEYRIELWRSRIPVQTLAKGCKLNVSIDDIDNALLSVGGIYVAIGTIKHEKFIVQKLLNESERQALKVRKDRFEIQEAEV